MKISAKLKNKKPTKQHETKENLPGQRCPTDNENAQCIKIRVKLIKNDSIPNILKYISGQNKINQITVWFTNDTNRFPLEEHNEK